MPRGFVDGDIFYGTMDLDYDVETLTIAPMMRAVAQQLVGPFPNRVTMKGGGQFEVRVRAARSQ